MQTIAAVSREDAGPKARQLLEVVQKSLGVVPNMMATMAGARSFFFCQPVPFYKYPNQQQDPICFKDKNTRFDYIYPIFEKNAGSLPGFTFLGNMLEQEKAYRIFFS